MIKECNLFSMLVGRHLPSDSCSKLLTSASPSVGKAFRRNAMPLPWPIVGKVSSVCAFTFKVCTVCTFSASIKQTKTDLLTCKHGRDYKINHVINKTKDRSNKCPADAETSSNNQALHNRNPQRGFLHLVRVMEYLLISNTQSVNKW